MARLLVICAKRYNGHELWTLLGVLKQRGHTFEVVSQATLIRDELTLRPNTIDRTVYEVHPDKTGEFDAVVVVSGNMQDTEAYWTDKHVEALLHEFRGAGKVVGAICCSVPTLAPVAKGVHVSYFPLVRSKQRLRNYGAILEPVSLTVDVEARMATAENQMISQMWAEELSNLLEDLPPKYHLQPSGFVPKGSPRILPGEIHEMIASARTAQGLEVIPNERPQRKDPQKL